MCLSKQESYLLFSKVILNYFNHLKKSSGFCFSRLWYSLFLIGGPEIIEVIIWFSY
uniref:Uncharacterized protein n=1 Tax=Rhizophora mucronata TaxID=61149 RepID=A0A2P2MH56_RHIMU